MKEKILQALKTKYPTNLGFSQKTLEMVASYLEANITEESQIDASIGTVEPLLKSFQSEADARATSAIQKAKLDAQKDKKGDEKQEPTMPPIQSDDIPSWAKGLTDTISALTSKINTLELGKTLETRKSVLESKLTNCSPELKAKIVKDFSRMNFETQEDFEYYMTETEQDVATLAQQASNESLSSIPKPFMGKVTKDGISTATAEYIETLGNSAKASIQGKPLFD